MKGDLELQLRASSIIRQNEKTNFIRIVDESLGNISYVEIKPILQSGFVCNGLIYKNINSCSNSLNTFEGNNK